MRHLNRYILVFIFFNLGFVGCLLAQKNKSELEKQKSLILKDISEAEVILNQTSTKKNSSIGQLNALNRQIKVQRRLINNYTSEVKIINSKIAEDQNVIEAMNSDLENFKEEYSYMVYSMFKTSQGFDRLAFIFSSENLSQFYMRFKYLEQYSSARKNQVKLISDIMDEIESEMNSLQKSREEKKKLLTAQISEKDKLDKLKVEQNKVLASLKSQESKIKKDISQKQDEITKLERLIAKLLKEELKKSSNATSGLAKANIDLKNVSNLFENNKANLPWPVNTGFISGKFGTHPHPVLRRVKVPNDGVNIQTKQDEKVRAVFEGEVKKIAIVPGEFKYVVIVQHGTYFTVYAKLKKVNVKMGQQIAKQDVIGEVNTDNDGISEVQFQVWKNTTKLDPELWLAKR